MIGSTIFYAAALAPLVPSRDFDPLSPDQIAAHKRDALHTVRHALGMRPAAKKDATKPIEPARKQARAR